MDTNTCGVVSMACLCCQGYEDVLRHRTDADVNSRHVHVLRGGVIETLHSRDIQVRRGGGGYRGGGGIKGVDGKGLWGVEGRGIHWVEGREEYRWVQVEMYMEIQGVSFRGGVLQAAQ